MDGWNQRCALLGWAMKNKDGVVMVKELRGGR